MAEDQRTAAIATLVQKSIPALFADPDGRVSNPFAGGTGSKRQDARGLREHQTLTSVLAMVDP